MRYLMTFVAVAAWLGACSSTHDANSGSKKPGGSKEGAGKGGGDETTKDGGGNDEPENLGPALTYYRDVKPIMDAKCKQCHFNGGIAPVAFTNYAEVEPFTALISLDVSTGKMPPWRASGDLDKYVGDRRLTPKQKDTIVRWVKQGAAEGDPSEEPERPKTVKRGLPRVDLDLALSEAYTPTAEDDYRCFLLGWPYDETKYITGLGIEPENLQTVHHAILYLIAPDGVAAARDKEAEDDLPGYACFGSTIDPWLTSYEPGGFGDKVPGELGFEIEPGSQLMLQIHYNTLNDDSPDQSHVQLMIEDKVDRVGDVVLIMQPLWPAGGMAIPANDPDVMHTYRGRPAGLGANTTYDLFWADLHMHALGSRGGIAIVRAGTGIVEPLLEIPEWAFEWQETFNFKKPVQLMPGDQLMVECHFDNTAANQIVVQGKRLTPRDLNWGEGTTDEMCLGNVLASPAVGSKAEEPDETDEE